jgi:hypothetical protein
MEAIDLGLDWDFYAEINSTEQQIHHKTSKIDLSIQEGM